jgi:Filamentous haemagglutinin family outer membrane protein.
VDPASTLNDVQLHDASLWQARAANGVEPVRIYAVNGDITDGLVFDDGYRAKYTVSQLSLIPNSPAALYAGGDITDLPFLGENYQSSDITSVIAGGSITYNLIGSDISNIIELAGPGSLYVQAGGDIAFKSQRLLGIGESGIITIGNQIDNNIYFLGSTRGVTVAPYNFVLATGNYGNPTLPAGGADVEVVYGAKFGLDTANFINSYVKASGSDAASADYLDMLNAFLKKQKKGDGNLGAAAAWAAFQSLPELAKRMFVTEVYFDILDKTGVDYNNPLSDNYQKYGRGYQAINTLFPSSWGYTANSLDGGTNGANTLVNTGLLDIRGSRIQTGQGGNIAILGPGGRILVGSASASVAANPASEGIITFENGNIDIFADQSILVAQSRIMTEQGGNLVIWSSNGDINAGKGAKTAVSNPPPVYACDITHYCVLDSRGVVTGAGIASLQTLENSPLGDVNMVAPRGTVDAGAAGIRVSGNLNIAAMYVANAFNITVKGTAIGVPTLTTNLNLATVSNAATEATAILNTMKTQEPQNTVDVEVTGFGGDVSRPDECVPNSVRPCK